MTYYEELGLPRTATQEQIRRAYRSACLLLHPDRHSDPELARMAKLQMQRMNDLYHTLSEPDKRLRYDQEISAGLAKYAEQGIEWATWIRKAGWYAGAALGVVLISWYISGERIKTAAVATQPTDDVEIAGGARLAARRTARIPSSRKTVREPSKPEPERVHEMQPSPVRGMPVPSQLAGAQLSSLPSAGLSTLQSEASPRLAGTWFYAHPPEAAQTPAGFYAPQFIQVTIREAGTRIQGRYAARYSIPDRAISPDVSFRFEGTINDDRATMTWSGSDGSKGDAQIILLAENRMELSWSAAELGQQLGLAEGRAVLVRASPR
jgi:hypothetical protein